MFSIYKAKWVVKKNKGTMNKSNSIKIARRGMVPTQSLLLQLAVVPSGLLKCVAAYLQTIAAMASILFANNCNERWTCFSLLLMLAFLCCVAWAQGFGKGLEFGDCLGKTSVHVDRPFTRLVQRDEYERKK